ncbi:hypothetical protein P4O66_022034 [Electrophorus voltai]|nr:hypothetical protein P4O66_022034 [Electrophorus voltai]
MVARWQKGCVGPSAEPYSIVEGRRSPLRIRRGLRIIVLLLILKAFRERTMPEVKTVFKEVLPKQGQLSMEDVPTMVLCKPRLLPLKSVTLEKLEKMQQEAQRVIKQQETAQQQEHA